jgi:hypothetical protein
MTIEYKIIFESSGVTVRQTITGAGLSDGGGTDRPDSGGTDKTDSGGTDRTDSGGTDRPDSGGTDRPDSGGGGWAGGGLVVFGPTIVSARRLVKSNPIEMKPSQSAAPKKMPEKMPILEREEK